MRALCAGARSSATPLHGSARSGCQRGVRATTLSLREPCPGRGRPGRALRRAHGPAAPLRARAPAGTTPAGTASHPRRLRLRTRWPSGPSPRSSSRPCSCGPSCAAGRGGPALLTKGARSVAHGVARIGRADRSPRPFLSPRAPGRSGLWWCGGPYTRGRHHHNIGRVVVSRVGHHNATTTPAPPRERP
jgi:hypothetical protein